VGVTVVCVVCLSTTKVIIHYIKVERKLIGKYTCSQELSDNGCLEWPRTLTKENKMAKGLKIAHERDDGTLVDQRISNAVLQGAVGGIPQWITGAGVRTLKVQFRDVDGVLHSNGYIITQKGSTTFLVANAVGAVEGATHSNASVTVATLASGADATTGVPAATASTCSIVGYTTANAAFYDTRITNKYVYDGSTKMAYRHAATQVATSDWANVVVH
jgi:hypothetical protein